MVSTNSIEEIILKDKCCGCLVCKSVCPNNAVRTKEDANGFIIPSIDKEKCNNCGLCKNICPILNQKHKNSSSSVCYSVIANDEIRGDSSSGGAFTLLAKYVFSIGGYVAGAAYTKNWNVEHIIINSENDLDKLRRSKYIHSNTDDIYPKIKDLLENDNYVLFSGTPCQISALKNYLDKEYKKLLTADLICHGISNYKIFKKFLEEQVTDLSKIKSLNFRNKDYVWWTPNYLTIELNNSKKITTDTFSKAFLQNLTTRTSCSICPYTSMKRVGDITIGDFWGIDSYSAKLNDNKGTSVVILNNKKAGEIFKNIEKICKNDYLNVQKVPKSIAKNNNTALVAPSKKNKNWNYFFELIKNNTFEYSQDKALNDKYDVAIIGSGFVANYGAILTNYAMYKLIESLNLKPIMIDKPKKLNSLVFNDTNYNKTIARIFAEKYMNLSKVYNDNKDLSQLNNNIDTFIVDSDQNWRVNNFGDSYYFFLDWVIDSKRKLSYAVSFAIDKLEVDEITQNNISYLLKRFNAISVREDSGVDICKNQLGVDASRVLDPVFVVDKKIYEDLIDNIKIKKSSKEYIFAYILDDFIETTKIVDYTKSKLNLDFYKVRDIMQEDYKTTNSPCVEEFIYKIKNSKFVITDSYHGVCFSIIFNKPFICIPHRYRGFERFKSLLNMLNLNDRMVNSIKELEEKEYLFQQFDYTNINKILQREIEKSRNWLKIAIFAPQKNISTNFDYHNFDKYKLEESIDKFNNDFREYKNEIADYIKNNNSHIELYGKLIDELYKRNKILNHKIILIKHKSKIMNSYRLYFILNYITLGKISSINLKYQELKILKNDIKISNL